MERFKAYRLTETPEKKIRAEFVETTLDQLDPGDVTVRVAYSSVNYKDALAATGKGKILRRPSAIGGIDFAGTVMSSTDPRFKKGDAVLTTSGEYVGVSHDGGYSPYARVKGDWIIKMPQGLSLWEAMAYGTAGYTAGIAMVRMEHEGLKPANGPVIVNGATGGVGSIIIAMLAKSGYHVVALTGKESESDWLKKLGAKEIMLRQSLNLQKIKPLDKATWAGAVDNLGGEVLSWMASTMKENGVIASIGLAASASFNTTVMPFILRGARLLGINSGDSANDVRDLVWKRLASDLKPPLLKEMCRTIPFAELPGVFDDFINAKVSRRVVVDLTD
ncbi:MAG: acryloyl-CoA reductase [Betaproteobacteria bacterium]|nr:acryloyl-CoA reductase [Betaproteobacteria bacterium]MBV9361729.1 acryloyl-CoA reductase [Betaproteobacteria bacterium]